MLQYEKEVLKIKNKIDSISCKGPDGVFDYYTYIDEVVCNKKYGILENVMIEYYNIDIRQYNSVDDMKLDTFPKVRFFNVSDFQKQLKKYYDSNNVYQMGLNIYNNTSGNILGEIMEINSNIPNFPYYQDPELTRKNDEPIYTSLKISPISGATPSLINDSTILLIDKYKEGIQIILNQ